MTGKDNTYLILWLLTAISLSLINQVTQLEIIWFGKFSEFMYADEYGITDR